METVEGVFPSPSNMPGVILPLGLRLLVISGRRNTGHVFEFFGCITTADSTISAFLMSIKD